MCAKVPDGSICGESEIVTSIEVAWKTEELSNKVKTTAHLHQAGYMHMRRSRTRKAERAGLANTALDHVPVECQLRVPVNW